MTAATSTTKTGSFPIFDGHNDVLLALTYPKGGEERTFFVRSGHGHIDLPRAREGGFGGGFFAVYVPATAEQKAIAGAAPVYTDTGYTTRMASEVPHDFAQDVATAVTASLFRLVEESKGQVKVVRTAAELQDCLDKGVLAVVLHFEGAEPIDPGLDALYLYHEAGLRSLGPVWSRPNIFATGVPFRFPHSPDTGPGLTVLGKELIRTCNRLHIMIDLAHMNEKGFWDIASLSDAPLVATHTAAHALCPSTRNLTDKQLDAIKETDGMVGINFNVRDLRADGKSEPDTPLTEVVRHADYLIERIGIDRVGFGSDFDGATMSKHLGDVAGLPKLLEAFRERGYDEESLRKLTHENWVRVLRKTWGE
jgi:membrane dipeptidase